VRVGPRAGRNVYPQLFVNALARDQLIATERTALHIAAEDVQLTFLCTAITAGFALCHSSPCPILPRASRGLPVAASVAYLCSHHAVAFPPGRVHRAVPSNQNR